jgi:hypothetical protein
VIASSYGDPRQFRSGGVHQDCAVDVSGMRVLELRTSCSGAPWWAHGVWGDARLQRTNVERKADTDKLFLAQMNELEVKLGPWRFGKGDQGNPQANYVELKGMKSPMGLGMHPPPNGVPACVKYRLRKQGKALRTSVGICDGGKPASPVFFQVFGDGKLLWESKPEPSHGATQSCDVIIENVDLLELRVHCPGNNHGAHAAWFEPHILLSATSKE